MLASALGPTATMLALVASVCLILLNGFYVAYEFAVVGARRSAFEEGSGGEGRIASAARASLSDLNMQLAGAQLGITIASLALGRVGEPALESIFEAVLGQRLDEDVARVLSFATALAIFTSLHLIFGEMVPKNIALAAPETTLRWLVVPYRMYLFVFRPLISLLNGVANGLCRMVGIEPRDEIISVHTASELASIVSHSERGGAIEADDAELLQGALHFAQRPVSDIATPVEDHASVVLGVTAGQLERLVASTGSRRILVHSSAGSEPVGYIHARDLLTVAPGHRPYPMPAAIVRQMAVAPGDRSLIDVLRMLRRVGRQLAVVHLGEDRLGVVSMEEVVRALVEPAPITDGGDDGRLHDEEPGDGRPEADGTLSPSSGGPDDAENRTAAAGSSSAIRSGRRPMAE